MPVEEQQLQQFFTTIQGGAQYPISSAESLIADNGDPLFNVVNEVTYAWNGAVAEAQMLVTMGAAAVTTGMALLTAPVSAPVVAIGLALGLTSGYLLYDLQPEVFNDIAEELEAAGQTIGGKVISFVNADGQTGYSQTTIEIIKNALLSAGAFEQTPELDSNFLIGTSSYPPNNATAFHNQAQHVVSGFNPTSLATQYIGNSIRGYSVDSQYSELGLQFLASRNSGPAIIMFEFTNFEFDGVRLLTARLVKMLDYVWFRATKWADNNGIAGSVYITTPSEVAERTTVWSFTFDTTRPSGTPGVDYFEIVVNRLFMRLITTNDSWTPECNMGLLDRGYGFGDSGANWPGIVGVGDLLPPAGAQDGATLPTGDPISTTYPNWDPWTVPQEIPDLTIFPVSEPVPDGEQDPAQTGDNDDQDQIQSIWDKIFIPDPPDPDPITPEPEPVPDPDPQPDDPEPVPEPDPVPPEPDPVPPNPPIPPSPIPPIPVLPADVGSNAMFTVYNPSLAQVNAFGGWLWSANIIDMLLRMWTDPLEGIIAFQKVYAVPSVGASKNIKVGYVDSEVPAPVVTSQFVTVNCGTINVDEVMHNATDYTPYSSLYLYLPFIGFVELDVNEFMAGSITVTYHVDVYTGTCLAEVKSTRSPDMPNSTIIYTFSGNASQQLPLTSSNFAGAISALVSAVGGGLSIASGGSIGAVAGIKQIGHSLTHEMIHIGRSGSLSANAGIMGGRTPFIIIGRRHGYDANAYNELYGYPANKTVYLSNCHGFTRVKAGFLRSKATEEEKNEIMSFLQEGVIL